MFWVLSPGAFHIRVVQSVAGRTEAWRISDLQTALWVWMIITPEERRLSAARAWMQAGRCLAGWRLWHYLYISFKEEFSFNAFYQALSGHRSFLMKEAGTWDCGKDALQIKGNTNAVYWHRGHCVNWVLAVYLKSWEHRWCHTCQLWPDAEHVAKHFLKELSLSPFKARWSER